MWQTLHARNAEVWERFPVKVAKEQGNQRITPTRNRRAGPHALVVAEPENVLVQPAEEPERSLVPERPEDVSQLRPNNRVHLTGYSGLRPLPPASDAGRWRHLRCPLRVACCRWGQFPVPRIPRMEAIGHDRTSSRYGCSFTAPTTCPCPCGREAIVPFSQRA